MAGSEDYDEEGVYKSDEEVTCIMHTPRYTSSSSGELETEMTGTSRFSPESRGTPSSRFIKGEFKIYSENVKSLIARTHPEILKRFQTFGSGITGCVYLMLSPIFDWTMQVEKPTNVICDAWIFSPTRPVTLLTFKTQTEKDKSRQYNAKLARHLITSVRKDLFSDFTVVSGVMDVEDCSTDGVFGAMISQFQSEAKTISVPRWLNMDKIKHEKLLDYFRKMIPTSSQEEVRQTMEKIKLQTLPGLSGLSNGFISVDKRKKSYSTDRKQQSKDDELSRVAGEMHRMNEVLMDTAQKVKELSEKVDDMRTGAFSQVNQGRFVQMIASIDVAVQTPVWSSGDSKHVLPNPTAHDLFLRRPSAPPPYQEAVRRQEVLRGASKEQRRFSLGNGDLALPRGQTAPWSSTSETFKVNILRGEGSVESVVQKDENLTDNQKFRRTKSDKGRSAPSRISMGRRASSFC